MSRLEKVPFWFAVGLVWLFSVLVVAGQLEVIFNLVTGKRLFGGAPISACDIPHFCMNGESEVPLSYVSTSTIQLHIAQAAATVLVVLIALVVGTSVIRLIAKGRAFAPVTLRRMGFTGLVLIFGGIVLAVISDAATSATQADSIAFQEAVHPDFGAIAVGVKPMLSFAIVFAGVLALALWAAFRQGARMREELDYVI
ncbi:MAG: DUF2975 domain-containing protein [Actinomycetaceae bacterium]|nr:DUF2975 domain-containing protein [Actinomycetaceae bacterium]